jgi:ubiquinone/menaquinone biosynthesis C-methylase UbiE
VTDLPLSDDEFDIASSEAAFQMVEHLDRALSEAYRVLRPGGMFVPSVPRPLNEVLDAETGSIERSYLDRDAREIIIDEDYDSTLTVFDRPIADVHDGLLMPASRSSE